MSEQSKLIRCKDCGKFIKRPATSNEAQCLKCEAKEFVERLCAEMHE